MSTQHLTKIETAGQFAEAAAELRMLSLRIAPSEPAPGQPADRYADAKQVIVFHLRCANTLLRSIADAKAGSITK